MESALPNFYEELTAALRERIAVIADHGLRDSDPAAHLNRLMSVSQQIMELQAKLPKDASPRLAHFLERCSYDKALDFLNGSSEIEQEQE